MTRKEIKTLTGAKSRKHDFLLNEMDEATTGCGAVAHAMKDVDYGVALRCAYHARARLNAVIDELEREL